MPTIFQALLQKDGGPDIQLTDPDTLKKGQNRVMTLLEHFSFGRLQSTWIVLEGDGIYQYLPKTIRTHFNASSKSLPPDLMERKEQVERSQITNRASGLPFRWNGQRYSLDRFILNRNGIGEELALDLWFSPSDFYTFLATNMSLYDESLRRKYLQATDWSQPVPFFSNSFGISLLVITSDRFALLTRRAQGLASRPGEYNVSVCEGLSKADAVSADTPNLYNCAERGLTEELGLQVPEDFSPDKIHLLSFGVDTMYSQWGLLGIIKVYKTAQEILNYRMPGAKDKLEIAQIYAIGLEDLDEIVSFVFANSPWAPSALACLHHALTHEFGRSRLEDAIKRIDSGV